MKSSFIRRFVSCCSLLVALLLVATSAPAATTVELLLPLGRSAYQTNEWIDLSVARNSTEPLAAGDLVLTLSGEDGSRLSFTFPAKAVVVTGAGDKAAARATEHLHLNGALLRPGKYTLDATVDKATVTAKLEVFSHLRQTDFRLINWGRAAETKDQMVQGEDSLGYNLMYAAYGREGADAGFLRGGVDSMDNCVMSGAHQMDIRMECDWSDPLVTRGGTVRVVQRTLQTRTRGNVPGIHFYDEPGLTWAKDPATGELTPHAIPSQAKSYIAAFGKEPLAFNKVDPNKPGDVAAWNHWARWKLGFMDGAWKEAQFGVNYVRPDFVSVTQSQYGFSAFTDGYYFNVVRSLPVTSGHGGYDDYGPCYFNPSYTLEMARARDYVKPNWYLPTWYGNMPPDRFRAEQYLSFQTNLQGMISPPDLEPAINPGGRQGIVESNQLMKRLGGIFTTMPVTKPPVAMLYSLSQSIHAQTLDRSKNYIHEMPQGLNLPMTYLAGKMIQQQFLAVVEEDILDGTLANDHKALIITSVDYLEPQVITELEQFIASGGLVLLSGDSKVAMKGAIKLDVTPTMPEQKIIDELMAQKKYNDLAPYQTMGKFFTGVLPYAKAIKAQLDKAGIKPILESSLPTITTTRQAAGDIEYLFAVNTTYDGSKNQKNDLAPAVATLALGADGRPVYDALVGGPAAEFAAKEGKLSGTVRFGAGQMRVFARTTRPIGGVKVATPTVTRQLTQDKEPIRVDIAATLLDNTGALVSGSAPLHVRVIDPLGVTRHEFYHATRQGNLNLSAPLAANDPPGKWRVVARDLLANTEHSATFDVQPLVRAASLAGAMHRAVYFGNDLDNVFRFARVHRSATIVKGSSEMNSAAAERLSAILKPWGVTCQIIDAATAAKPRTLSAEEAATWIGLVPGKAKAGENPPELVGFSVSGPVILLGNAEDNPLIKYLQEKKFLPYEPKAGVYPGVERGMVAWQRDGVGHGQESIALIAHDPTGMAEAVGTMYEAVAGLDPLTKWQLPKQDKITPAVSAPNFAPAAPIAWSLNLPDRIDALQVTAAGLSALSHDGSLVSIGPTGKPTANKPLSQAELAAAVDQLAAKPDAATAEIAKTQARSDRMLKLVAKDAAHAAIAYWGGTLRIVDAQGKLQHQQQLPQDITALIWLAGKPVVGLANGQVLALEVK